MSGYSKQNRLRDNRDRLRAFGLLQRSAVSLSGLYIRLERIQGVCPGLEHFAALCGVFSPVVDAAYTAQLVVQRLLNPIRLIAHLAQARGPRPAQIMDSEMRHATLHTLQGPVRCALSYPTVMLLATGLCVAACRQKRRVRFTTAANLVNELVEAQQQNGVRRVLAKWMRYDVIALDEVGYVPLAEIGAEFLFQVIAERAERATLILTTNLPFSEWTQVFPNPRLCKALLDRITDRAHIIETGTDSYRFRRTLEVRKKKGARSGDAVVTASATT